MHAHRRVFGRAAIAAAMLVASVSWVVFGPGVGIASATPAWTSSYPGPFELADAHLDGVSCTSGTACTAVGGVRPLNPYYGGSDTPLVERWNGTSWSRQTTPDHTGALHAVSCRGTAFCMAVGAAGLAERWNGLVWTVVSTGVNKNLTAVSCTSNSACTAVGTTVAYRWNGSTWTPQTVPVPSGASAARLKGVSCPTSTLCIAAGSRGLTERWNGTSWHVQAKPSGTGDLNAVSCTSSTACSAVGGKNVNGYNVTSVERWNGTAWTVQSSPNPTGGLAYYLYGVSCTSSTACNAVGYALYSSTTAQRRTIAEHWNGTSWSLKTTPNQPNAFYSQLAAVSCTSGAACLSVGQWVTTGQFLPRVFAERYAGGTWARQSPAALKRKVKSTLFGVSCPSSTSCVAVGYQNPGCVLVSCSAAPLIEHWNGTNWTSKAVSGINLFGVSCSSSTACTAVGSATGPHLAVRRWNGSSWAAQSISSSLTGSLYGVSCSSSTVCTAVGYFVGADSHSKPLVMRWNGTSWARLVAPVGTSIGNQFAAVSCTSSTACSAVGYRYPSAGGVKAFVERWNGTSWTIQTTPSIAGSTRFGAISCTSSTACTAVGEQGADLSTGTGGSTLVEAWNGTSWAVQTSPNPSAAGNRLVGVSCTSTTSCVAVGASGGSTSAPLTERWNGAAWTIEPTPGPALGGLAGVSCVAVTLTTSVCTAVGDDFGSDNTGFGYDVVNRYA